MASTPRRVYCRNNICVLCGFSFIQTDINDKGEKIEKKHFTLKYKLTDERVKNIKQVLQQFEVSSDRDVNNGVCHKCLKYVEKYVKCTKEAAEIKSQ